MSKTVSLGEITRLYDSLHKTPKNYEEAGYPMLRVTDVQRGFVHFEGAKQVNREIFEEFTKKYKPQVGDIIFTRVGSYGKSCFVDRPVDFCLGQNTVCITPNVEMVKPYYLYTFLNSPHAKNQIDAFITGSSQPTISLKSIKEIAIDLPPLKDQERLSAIAAAYDNLIEKNNRRIAILEEMAQSLYHEWFVKFRFPGYENCQFKDSPLGQIPEGWEVQKLKEVLELAYGKALKKSDRNGGAVSVYGSGGLGGWHDELLVEGPIIIVGRKGNVGRIFWVEEDCWPIDTVFYVKSELSKYYLYYNLLSQTFHNSDAAVPGLNRESAYSNKLIVPSVSVVSIFNRNIETTFRQLTILRKKNANLRYQRDLLLPKLISGKVAIKG